MSIPQNRLSDEPVPAPYIPPDDLVHALNEDWERGPIAVNDSSGGMANQDWKLTFSGGVFTVTPQTTGSPTDYLSGIDSIQCSFCFDQNAQPNIAWIDSSNIGHLYWYDTQNAMFDTLDLVTPVFGIALTLDDKRPREVRINDILLFYTIASGGGHALQHRRQRDRYTDIYPLADPVWPYIHKLGMHEALRVQISLSTAPPV